MVVMQQSFHSPKSILIPERARILLFLLTRLGKVVTELKLQKMIFQIQNEAKVPKGYRYFRHYYGPYSKELNMDTFTLMKEGLIEKEIVYGSKHSYWVFKITNEGNEFFEKSIPHDMSPGVIQRMNNVINKYKDYDSNELTSIVYEQWKIKKPGLIASEIGELRKDLQAVMSFWEAIYVPECPTITYFLAFLEYSQEALEKTSLIDDTVIKIVLVRACRELEEMLGNIAQVCSKKGMCPLEAEKGLCQTNDPSVYEIFDFIENYCEQNSILPKLSDQDLSKLMTGDEYRRLQKAFETFNPSYSS